MINELSDGTLQTMSSENESSELDEYTPNNQNSQSLKHDGDVVGKRLETMEGDEEDNDCYVLQV